MRASLLAWGTRPPVTTGPASCPSVAKATVTLSASDVYGSGVSETRYVFDGGAETVYTSPFSITKVGAHTLEFWSVDKAGNVEIARARVVHRGPALRHGLRGR